MTTTPAPAASGRAWTAADFDFELPAELIAQHPTPERSASRLLDGSAATPADRVFRDLPLLLEPGDLLVFNDTRVIKASASRTAAAGSRCCSNASSTKGTPSPRCAPARHPSRARRCAWPRPSPSP